MALMDFIKKQFIDIIQWTEEGDGILSWRFPMQDMEIQNGAALVVRASQMAVFVNEGQVAAQSLIAGARTVDEEFHVHSLHSYFLLPGDYQVPIIYDVERIRDGRSFATRRVTARQHGRPIYHQTLNFQRTEEGYEHQDAMPEVKPPEEGLDLVALMTQNGGADAEALGREWGALEVRWLGNSRIGLDPDPAHPAQARMWIRVRGEMGDDPLEHLAVFTYASDVSLLGASLAAHDTDPSQVQMASLDHSLWFHHPFRVDEWWLYDQWSPSASGSRGLSFGRVFRTDGVLAATAAQEGLIRRLKRPSAAAGDGTSLAAWAKPDA